MSDHELQVLEMYERSQGPGQLAGVKRKPGAAPAYVSAPMCGCGAGQCLTEQEPDGRIYFACPEQEDALRCDFKLYCDNQKQGRTSTGAGPSQAGNAVSRAGNVQLQQQGYAVASPAGGQWINNEDTAGDKPVAGSTSGQKSTPSCQCGDPTLLRTSNSDKNPGRQFYCCAKPQGDDSRCRFFAWLEHEAGTANKGHNSNGGASYSNNAVQTSQYGGGFGFGAQPPAAAIAADGDNAEVFCVCGAPAAMRTSNTAKNPGRAFYKCPKPQAEACNFFQWADQAPSAGKCGAAAAGSWRGNSNGNTAGWGGNASSTAAGGGNYGFGGGDSAAADEGLNGLNVAGSISSAAPGGTLGSVRFAWEDTAPPPAASAGSTWGGAGGGTGYGSSTAAGGGGNCFKCGGSGHWARDCPNIVRGVGAGTTNGGAYGAGSSYGGGAGTGANSNCFKCGTSGHWARDCPNVATTNAGGGYGGGRGNSSYGGGGGGGKGANSGSCYKCGQLGHWASSCPNS